MPLKVKIVSSNENSMPHMGKKISPPLVFSVAALGA